LKKGRINIEAMEARSVDTIPIGEEWQYEPKWDGFRCLLTRDSDSVAPCIRLRPSPVLSNNAQTAASMAPGVDAKTVKQPHRREPSSRCEKSALALMILRTIEFPMPPA
jgi:hypothetical protein